MPARKKHTAGFRSSVIITFFISAVFGYTASEPREKAQSLLELLYPKLHSCLINYIPYEPQLTSQCIFISNISQLISSIFKIHFYAQVCFIYLFIYFTVLYLWIIFADSLFNKEKNDVKYQ